MSLTLKNKLGIAFAMMLFLGQSAVAKEEFLIPSCPESVVIEDGKVLNTSGWNYSFNPALAKNGIPDGVVLSTLGKAPVIGSIRSANNSVGAVGGLEEQSTDDIEVYYWPEEFLNKSENLIFLCKAKNSEKGKTTVSVNLYQYIPSDVKNCRITFWLKDGSREWGSQRLDCYK